jgi:hypothetical protein
VGGCIRFGDDRRQRLDLGRLSRHTPERERGRDTSISATKDIDTSGLISAASVLFARGERPRADAIGALARDNPGFSVSLDPLADAAPRDGPDRPENNAAVRGKGPEDVHWLELLANGLTFDLAGLAPGAATPRPPLVHSFGLPKDLEPLDLEALTVRPGPHLAGGTTMPPLVRSMAWVAAILAALPGARAVAWHPARCWCAPQQFRESVLRWIEGGVFPAFSLAALAPTPDGGMQTEGLALFTGQELRLEAEVAENAAAGARLGLRLLHMLAEQGRVAAPETLTGPDGQRLRIEPSPNGRFVRVWKD